MLPERPLMVIVFSVIFAGVAVVAFNGVKSELTPNEDRRWFTRLTALQGSSLNTYARQDAAERGALRSRY